MLSSDLYVVVQAGGRGSRLRHHTWNKPKCLVSVAGKPILYHLFEVFPNAQFRIIGDYLFDQLQAYLKTTPPAVRYQLVKTSQKGTCAGIKDALSSIPADSPVILTWSDLRLLKTPDLSEGQGGSIIFTTNAFTCRWSLSEQGVLHESPSSVNGIPGIFYFNRRDALPFPPESGEFVRWLSKNLRDYNTSQFDEVDELGDYEAIERGNSRDGFCRFFNRVDINDNTKTVVKTVIDAEYEVVHKNEIAWYQDATRLGFRRIPKIISFKPLTMEKIDGKHAYSANDFSERERRAVLADYLDALISLHDLGSAPSSKDEINAVYIDKTKTRVRGVSPLIPMFNKDSITINGKKCKNIFSKKYEHLFESLVDHLSVDYFVPIHGDPTFSNSLIDDKLRVWFIDPRGSFGSPGIYGDAWYDFAKVYYSAVGGYDAFNRRKFKLHVDSDTVEVLMDTPLFLSTGKEIFKDYFGENLRRIEVLHGLIWLALSGYVRDDIDSVIGSFYLGLYWLEEGMER